MITENKRGFKDQKSSLLYHNSYDIYHNVGSTVNEPPYNKLMSQYICTKRLLRLAWASTHI